MPALLTGMRFVEKKERLGYPELATGVASWAGEAAPQATQPSGNIEQGPMATLAFPASLATWNL